MVFVGGAVLLISGATPAVQDRLLMVTDLMPLPVVEASHILGSMAGLGLLILARGLLRRLDAAWLLSVVLLAAGIAASADQGVRLRGSDSADASLWPCCCRAGAEFHRKAALTDFSFTPGWLLAVTGVVAGSIWLTLFSFRHVEYANSLWWQFAVTRGCAAQSAGGFHRGARHRGAQPGASAARGGGTAASGDTGGDGEGPEDPEGASHGRTRR